MSLKTTSRKLISLLMTVVMLLSMFQPFALAEGETAEELTAYDGTKAEIIAALVLTGYDAQTRTLSFDANVSAESKDTIDYIYNSVTGKLYDSYAERGAAAFGDVQTGSGNVTGNFEVVLEDSEDPADVLDELILKIYVDGIESGIEASVSPYDPEMIDEEGETGNGPQQAGGFTPLSTPAGVGTGHEYPDKPSDMTSNVPGISAARGQFPASQYYSESGNAFTLTTGSGALVFNIVYNIATSGDWTDGYFLVIQIPESSEVWESTETDYKVKTVFSNSSAYNNEGINFVDIGRVDDFFADGKDAYVYATWFDHDDVNLGERLMVRDNLRFEFNNGYTPNGYETEVAAYFYPAKLPDGFDVSTDIDAGYCAADYLGIQMTGAVRAMYGQTDSQDDVIGWYPSATITAVSEYPVGNGPDALYTINAALNGGTTSMTVPTGRTYADVYGSVTGTKATQSFTYKVDIDTPLTDTLRGRVFLENASVDVALSGFKNTPDGKPVSVVVSKAANGSNPIVNTYDGSNGNFSFDISGTELSPLGDTTYYIIVTYNKDPYTVMNDTMLALSEVSSANPDRLNGNGPLVATSLSAELNYTPVTDSKNRTVNTAYPADLAFGYTQAAPVLPTLTFGTKINVSGTVSAYDTAKQTIYPAAAGGLEYKLYTSGGTHAADGVVDAYGNTTLKKAASPTEDYQLAIGEYYLKINGGIAGFESIYYQSNQIAQSAQSDYRILIKVDDPDGDGSPRVQIDYTPDTAGDWELQPANWAFTYASQSKTTVLIPIERQAFGQSAAEWASMRADFPYTSAIQSTVGITMVSTWDAGAAFNNTLTTWSSEQTSFTLNPTVTYDGTFAYALFEGVPVPTAGTYTFSVTGGLTSILDSGITYNYIADQAVTVTIGSDAWQAPVKADQTLKFKSNKGGFKVGKVFVDDKATLTDIITNVGAVTVQFDLYKMDETGTTVIDTSAPTYTDVRISGTVNGTNKWLAPMEAKHYGGTAVGSSEFESGYYAIVETGIYKGINTGAAITGAAIDTTNNTVDGEYPLVGGTAANIIKVNALAGSYDSLPTGAATLVTNSAPNSIPDGALIADSQYGTMKIQSFGANASGGGFALPGMTYNIYKSVTGTRDTTPLLANVAQTSAGETVLRLPAGQYVIEWVTNNPWLLLGTGTTNGFSFTPTLNNTSTMTVLANTNHGGSANITFNDSMVDIETSSSQRTTAFLFGKMPRIEGTKINKTTSVPLSNADFLVYFKKNGMSDYVMLKNGGTPVTTNGGVPGASTAVTGSNGKFWHEVAYSATGDYVGEYLFIEYVKPGEAYKDLSYLSAFLGAGTTVGSVEYKDTVASSSISGVYSQIPKATVSGSKYGVENSEPAYNPQLVSAGNAENTLLVYFDARSRYAQAGEAEFAGTYHIAQYANWGVGGENTIIGGEIAYTDKTTAELAAHFYVDPGYTYIITQTSIGVGNAVNNTGDIIAVRVNDDGTIKVLVVTDLSELNDWGAVQSQPVSQNVETSADALITRTGFTTAQGSVTVYFGNLKIPETKFIKYGQTESEETYWDNEAQQLLTRPEEQLLTGAKFVIFYIGEDGKAYFIAQTTDPVLGTVYTLINPSGYSKSDIGLDGGDSWKKADAKTVKQKLFSTNDLYDALSVQSAATGVFAVGADSKMILPNLPVSGVGSVKNSNAEFWLLEVVTPHVPGSENEYKPHASKFKMSETRTAKAGVVNPDPEHSNDWQANGLETNFDYGDNGDIARWTTVKVGSDNVKTDEMRIVNVVDPHYIMMAKIGLALFDGTESNAAREWMACDFGLFIDKTTSPYYTLYYDKAQTQQVLAGDMLGEYRSLAVRMAECEAEKLDPNSPHYGHTSFQGNTAADKDRDFIGGSVAVYRQQDFTGAVISGGGYGTHTPDSVIDEKDKKTLLNFLESGESPYISGTKNIKPGYEPYVPIDTLMIGQIMMNGYGNGAMSKQLPAGGYWLIETAAPEAVDPNGLIYKKVWVSDVSPAGGHHEWQLSQSNGVTNGKIYDVTIDDDPSKEVTFAEIGNNDHFNETQSSSGTPVYLRVIGDKVGMELLPDGNLVPRGWLNGVEFHLYPAYKDGDGKYVPITELGPISTMTSGSAIEHTDNSRIKLNGRFESAYVNVTQYFNTIMYDHEYYLTSTKPQPNGASDWKFVKIPSDGSGTYFTSAYYTHVITKGVVGGVAVPFTEDQVAAFDTGKIDLVNSANLTDNKYDGNDFDTAGLTEIQLGAVKTDFVIASELDSVEINGVILGELIGALVADTETKHSRKPTPTEIITELRTVIPSWGYDYALVEYSVPGSIENFPYTVNPEPQGISLPNAVGSLSTDPTVYSAPGAGFYTFMDYMVDPALTDNRKVDSAVYAVINPTGGVGLGYPKIDDANPFARVKADETPLIDEIALEAPLTDYYYKENPSTGIWEVVGSYSLYFASSMKRWFTNIQGKGTININTLQAFTNTAVTSSANLAATYEVYRIEPQYIIDYVKDLPGNTLHELTAEWWEKLTKDPNSAFWADIADHSQLVKTLDDPATATSAAAELQSGYYYIVQKTTGAGHQTKGWYNIAHNTAYANDDAAFAVAPYSTDLSTAANTGKAKTFSAAYAAWAPYGEPFGGLHYTAGTSNGGASAVNDALNFIGPFKIRHESDPYTITVRNVPLGSLSVTNRWNYAIQTSADYKASYTLYGTKPGVSVVSAGTTLADYNTLLGAGNIIYEKKQQDAAGNTATVFSNLPDGNYVLTLDSKTEPGGANNYTRHPVDYINFTVYNGEISYGPTNNGANAQIDARYVTGNVLFREALAEVNGGFATNGGYLAVVDAQIAAVAERLPSSAAQTAAAPGSGITRGLWHVGAGGTYSNGAGTKDRATNINLFVNMNARAQIVINKQAKTTAYADAAYQGAAQAQFKIERYTGTNPYDAAEAAIPGNWTEAAVTNDNVSYGTPNGGSTLTWTKAGGALSVFLAPNEYYRVTEIAPVSGSTGANEKENGPADPAPVYVYMVADRILYLKNANLQTGVGTAGNPISSADSSSTEGWKADNKFYNTYKTGRLSLFVLAPKGTTLASTDIPDVADKTNYLQFTAVGDVVNAIKLYTDPACTAEASVSLAATLKTSANGNYYEVTATDVPAGTYYAKIVDTSKLTETGYSATSRVYPVVVTPSLPVSQGLTVATGSLYAVSGQHNDTPNAYGGMVNNALTNVTAANAAAVNARFGVSGVFQPGDIAGHNAVVIVLPEAQKLNAYAKTTYPEYKDPHTTAVIIPARAAKITNLPIQLWKQSDEPSQSVKDADAAKPADEREWAELTDGTWWRREAVTPTTVSNSDNTIGTASFAGLGDGTYKMFRNTPAWLASVPDDDTLEGANKIVISTDKTTNKLSVQWQGGDSGSVPKFYGPGGSGGNAYLNKNLVPVQSDDTTGATFFPNMRQFEATFIGYELVVRKLDYDEHQNGADKPLYGAKFAMYHSLAEAQSGNNRMEEVVTDEYGVAAFSPDFAADGAQVNLYIREVEPAQGYWDDTLGSQTGVFEEPAEAVADNYMLNDYYEPVIRTVSFEGEGATPKIILAEFLNKAVPAEPLLLITKSADPTALTDPLTESGATIVYTITPTLMDEDLEPFSGAPKNFTITDAGLTFKDTDNVTISANKPSYAITSLKFGATSYENAAGAKQVVYAQINGQTDTSKWITLSTTANTTVTGSALTDALNGTATALTVKYWSEKPAVVAGTDAYVGEAFAPGAIEVTVEIARYAGNKNYKEAAYITNSASASFDYTTIDGTGPIPAVASANSSNACVDMPQREKAEIKIEKAITARQDGHGLAEQYTKNRWYEFTLTLTNTHSTNDLINPVIIDYFGHNFTVAPDDTGVWEFDNSVISFANTAWTGAPGESADIEVYGNAAVWDFSGMTLVPGESAVVKIRLQLSSVVSDPKVINEAYGTSAAIYAPSSDNVTGAAFTVSSSNATVNATVNANDFNKLIGTSAIPELFTVLGISSPNTASLGQFAKTFVENDTAASGDIALKKSVRIAGGAWESGRNAVAMAQNQEAEYKVELLLDSTDTAERLRNVIIADILPFNSDGRGTTWENTLVNLWQLNPAGFAITRTSSGGIVAPLSADILVLTANPGSKTLSKTWTNYTSDSDWMTFAAWQGMYTSNPGTAPKVYGYAISIPNDKTTPNNHSLAMQEIITVTFKMQPLNTFASGGTLNRLGEDLMTANANKIASNKFTAFYDRFVGMWDAQSTDSNTVRIRLAADPITIDGTVWHDADDDGVWDPAETAVMSGLTVNLYKKQDAGSWTHVTSRTTDGSGEYSFTTDGADNSSGNPLTSSYGGGPLYKVEVENPNTNTYAFTQANPAVNNDTAKSAVVTIVPEVTIGTVVPEKGHTGDIGLTVDETGEYNFGLVQLSTISGAVWLDADRNGLKNGAEGYSNASGDVTVSLMKYGTSDYAAVTGAAYQNVAVNSSTGAYTFTKLRPGTYKVKFDKSALSSSSGVYRWTDYDVTGTVNSDLVIRADTAANTLADKTAAVGYTAGTGGTDGIVITAGTTSTNAADAGYTLDMNRIEGIVWKDVNADGNKDAGDNGIANVPYKVYKVAVGGDVQIGTGFSLTGADGTYSFTHANLIFDGTEQYYVVFGTAAFLNAGGYNFARLSAAPGAPAANKECIASVTVQTANANLDETGTTVTITPALGSEVSGNVNAALYEYSTITGQFWYETDDNGIKDTGEDYASHYATYGAVTAKLYKDTVLKQTETINTADGTFTFTGLPTGNYTVEFVKASGTVENTKAFWWSVAGTANTVDHSDVTVYTNRYTMTSGKTNTIAITSNDTALNAVADGAITVKANEIKGTVWEDDNYNGTKDGADTGLSGIPYKIQVDDSGWQDIAGASGTTAADGTYSYNANGDGLDFTKDYRVVFGGTAGFSSTYKFTTTAPDTSVPTADKELVQTVTPLTSNAALDDVGTTYTLTASAANNNEGVIGNVNATVYRYSTITGKVWIDSIILDNLQTAGEGYNANDDDGDVLVTLYKYNGSGDDSDIANYTKFASGNALYDGLKAAYTTGAYSFTGLPKGKYKVMFSNGLDANPQNFYRWVEPNVTTGLAGGATADDYENADSDAVYAANNDDAAATTGVIEIAANNTTTSNLSDAGLFSKGHSMQGFVFEDKNYNGVYDAGVDDYLDGVTVKLYRKLKANAWPSNAGDWASYTVYDTVVTGSGGLANGEYVFDGVNTEPGLDFTAYDYKVFIGNTVGTTTYQYSATKPSHTLGDVDNSQMIDGTGYSNNAAAPSAGQFVTTGINGALYITGTISGTIWNDGTKPSADATVGDGVKNGSETYDFGANVKVSLMKWSGVAYVSAGAAYTNVIPAADGTYSFTNLQSGDYKVVVDKTALTSNSKTYHWSPTTGTGAIVSGVTGVTAVGGDLTLSPVAEKDAITLAYQGAATVNAGIFTNLNSISGYAWEDTNYDGVKDGGESYLNGVTAQVQYSTDGTNWNNYGTAVTTGANGIYVFTNGANGVDLTAGRQYRAVFTGTDTSTWKFSKINANDDKIAVVMALGSNNALDGWAYTDPVALNTDTGITNGINAGMWQVAKISGEFWYEDDNDGVKEPGEEYSASNSAKFGTVQAKLYKNDVHQRTLAVTPGTGAFEFTGLKSGTDYRVEFVKANGTGVNNYAFCWSYPGTPNTAEHNDIVNDAANAALDSTTKYILTSGRTDLITLAYAGTNSTAADGAVTYHANEIIGQVWSDDNYDGIADGSDAGISGIPYQIQVNDGGWKDIAGASGTTVNNGNYSYNANGNGLDLTKEYRVVFGGTTGFSNAYKFTSTTPDTTVPTATKELVQTVTPLTSNPALDDKGTTYAVTAGDANLNGVIEYVNATLYAYSKIIGQFWYETDDNGIKDSGEDYASNYATYGVVTANLYKASEGAAPVQTVQVNTTNGTFIFTGLQTGSDYTVEFVKANGTVENTKAFWWSAANENDVTTYTDKYTMTSGKTSTIAITTNGSTLNTVADGAITVKANEIKGTVWEDEDYNGTKDGAETGEDGIPYAIQKSDNGSTGWSTINTGTTSGGGLYSYNGESGAGLDFTKYYRVIFGGDTAFTNLYKFSQLTAEVTVPTANQELIQTVTPATDDRLDSSGTTYAVQANTINNNEGVLGNVNATVYKYSKFQGTFWYESDTSSNGAKEVADKYDMAYSVKHGEVTAQLYKVSNGLTHLQSVDVSLTDGSFEFTGLKEGTDYAVRFIKANGTVENNYAYWWSPAGTANTANQNDVTLYTPDKYDMTLGGATAYNRSVAYGAVNSADVDGAITFKQNVINGTVWEDKNLNGVKDALETGASGIPYAVQQSDDGLTGWTTIADSLSSGANGQFTYSGIDGIDFTKYYRVVFGNTTPFTDTYKFSSVDPAVIVPTANTELIETITAAANPALHLKGTTYAVNAPAGSAQNKSGEISNVNATVYRYSKITGTVWNDGTKPSADATVGDGVKNGSEIYDFGANVTVSLLKDSGSGYVAVDANYTNMTVGANGAYEFTGLVAGNYKVVVDKTALTSNSKTYHWSPTTGTGTIVSDVIGTTSPAWDLTLSPTAEKALTSLAYAATGTVNAGIFTNLNSISGYAWEDRNYDGTKDASPEDGLSGVTAQVQYSTDGTNWSSYGTAVTTGADGTYTFTNGANGVDLTAGRQYRVVFTGTDTSTWKFSKINANDDKVAVVTALSSNNALDASGITDPVALNTVTGIMTGINAGMWRAAKISGVFWYEDDNDGVKDPGEGYTTADKAAYGAVTAKLYKDGTLLQTLAVTEGTGAFEFTGLKLGSDYQVEFVKANGTAENNTAFWWSPVGSANTAGESDVSVYTDKYAMDSGKTADSVTVTYGGTNNNAADGAVTYKANVITGCVWEDGNYDGVIDGTESGVENVTVKLYKGAALYETVTTDANGMYVFNNAGNGVDFTAGNTYTVEVINPAEAAWKFTALGGTSVDDDIITVTPVADTNGIRDAKAVTAEYEPTAQQNLDGEISSLNAGIYLMANIAGVVWLENDADDTAAVDVDGIKANEEGYTFNEAGDVKVSLEIYDGTAGEWVLYDAANPAYTEVIPNADGEFLFEALKVDGGNDYRYRVRFDKSGISSVGLNYAWTITPGLGAGAIVNSAVGEVNDASGYAFSPELDAEYADVVSILGTSGEVIGVEAFSGEFNAGIYAKPKRILLVFNKNSSMANNGTVTEKTVYYGFAAGVIPVTSPEAPSYSDPTTPFLGWGKTSGTKTQDFFDTTVIPDGVSMAANTAGLTDPDTGEVYDGIVTVYAIWKRSGGGGGGGGGGGAPAEEKPALTDTHILYIQGYPVADGETLPQVRPQGEITRAEVATIFWRLLKDEAKTVTANGSFPDVPRFEGDDWYVQQVNYLTKIGVLTGYPDGTFQPSAKITRAELATILSRFAAYTGEDVSNPFSDVADHWAYKNIMTAVKNGWINGYPDGTFRPQQNITRAETMVMINRALGRNPSDNSVLKLVDPAKVYNDISGHWAWLDVLEASIEHEYSRAASDSTEDWIEIHWYEIGKLPADYWLKGVKEWTLTVRR